jgi:apolipoprotein N-acyltransferase
LLLLAAASGAAYALAFPPFALPGVAFVALVPLFWACAVCSPGRAALLGWVWTTAAALALGHWLPATIARFFEVPAGLGWLALLTLAWLPAAVPIAGFCAFLAWASRSRALGPLGVGAAFGLTEVARSYAWLPLPYAPLGSAALPDALVQNADWLGVFGVGMLVAAVNAALAALLTPALRARRPALGFGVAAAVVAGAFLSGLARPAPPAEPGAALSVAAVQPGVAARLADPHAPESRERHAAALALTRELRGRGHDLVVWPEHAVGFYLREHTPAAETVLALSRELDADLLLGGPHYRFASPEPRYFASAFLFAAGELRGRHDKTQLVPIAERGYDSGERLRALPGSHAAVGALLCAEMLFPGVARALAKGGAEILANPSNDAWLVPAAAEHMLRLAALRAIENRRPVVRATPTGVSAVIDARGRVLARSRPGAREVIEARVVPGRSRTLTQRFGDWPVSLAVLGVGLAAVRALRSPRRFHA